MDHHSRSLLLLVHAIVLLIALPLRGQRAEFDIVKGSDVVGRIIALKHEQGTHTNYVMTSYAEIDMVLKQVVRTSMAADYLNGLLRTCHSTVKVNRAVRDSSSLAVRDGKQFCYVHPGPAVQKEQIVAWTTARMYFEEPKDQAFIFVESVLAPCPLKRTSEGHYTLTFPNKNENRYVYRDGVLQEIHVDRALFDLLFRRT